MVHPSCVFKINVAPRSSRSLSSVAPPPPPFCNRYQEIAVIYSCRPHPPGCGASSSSTADGRTWDGDADSKFHASNPETASSAFTASQQDPSVTQVPYMTAPTYSNLDISKSRFSLSANTYTLLNNFSAFLTVSAMKPSVASFIKEYHYRVDNQKLDLTFSPSPSSFAFINGIEIISMPNNLYASGNNNPLPYLGIDSNQFYLDNTTALEKFYRLNVGGQDISGNDDTVHRTWLQDLNTSLVGQLVCNCTT
ncbi:hypothetical protein GH714_031025 [Hevea brasiliensis]|uniref:Malectin-like domain-containing protein n=1 Tax=Hevea brasiliensis TaxID=3981 RepID=A0A6A6LFI0_HEVBR|nr:hypothetical protein GH714_031025 [Hevea brasiliensis]